MSSKHKYTRPTIVDFSDEATSRGVCLFYGNSDVEGCLTGIHAGSGACLIYGNHAVGSCNYGNHPAGGCSAGNHPGQ